MKDIVDIIKNTYNSVVGEYRKTFIDNHYLPTKDADSSLVINGFTERNLTFNFCHAYLNQHKDAIVWQETPIIHDDTKREHIDSIIIDKIDEDNYLAIYLEAKRLYGIAHFQSLLEDLHRIKKYHSYIPIPRIQEPHKIKHEVVVLLADLYYSDKCKTKTEYKNNYYNNFFIGQKVNTMDKISNKYPNLSKRIDEAEIIKVCNSIQDIQTNTIEIPKGDQYNIKVNDDIYYTIYCGVYFINGTEKK